MLVIYKHSKHYIVSYILQAHWLNTDHVLQFYWDEKSRWKIHEQ